MKIYTVLGVSVVVVNVVKKNWFIKGIFSCGWFEKIGVWLKLWLKKK